MPAGVSDDRIVAVFEAFDEFVAAAFFRSFFDFFVARALFSDADIFAHAFVEKIIILRHESDASVVRFERNLSDIDAA